MCSAACCRAAQRPVEPELLAFRILVGLHILAGTTGAVAFWAPIRPERDRVFVVALLATQSRAVHAKRVLMEVSGSRRTANQAQCAAHCPQPHASATRARPLADT